MPHGNTIPIGSGTELEEAVRVEGDPEVAPGDEIVLADGSYEDCEVEIDLRGSEDAPITIRAESDHGAVFTGTSHLRITG